MGGRFPRPSRLELEQPPCPGGPHVVRPTMVVHESHSDHGKS
jgi:hypothetical protein